MLLPSCFQTIFQEACGNLMTLSSKTHQELVDTITLERAKGSPVPLAAQTIAPNQVLVTDDTKKTPFLEVSGSPQLLQELSVSVKCFSGKGGVVSILHSAKSGLDYFLFPGASVKKGAVTIRVPGESHVSTTPSGIYRPEKTIDSVQAHTDQVMILGAGIGSRILPLTTEATGIAKPALPLGDGKNVIGELVLHLARHGFRRFFVNTYYLRTSVQKALEDAIATLKAQGLDVSLTEIEEHRATGTAGGLWTMLKHPAKFPHLDTSKPLLIVQGDAVTDAHFSSLVSAHQANQSLITIGCQTVSDEDVDKFGIMATRQQDGETGPSGEIHYFLEKPPLEKAGPHRLGSTGFYVLAPEVYPAVLDIYNQKLAAESTDEVEELDFAKDIFPALLPKALEKQILDSTGNPLRFWAQEVTGFWSDIGNPAQYIETLHALHGVSNSKQSEFFDSATGVFFWPASSNSTTESTKATAQQDAFELTGPIVVSQNKPTFKNV
jgi:NDP-sugar pyrophosphorylase family protein